MQGELSDARRADLERTVEEIYEAIDEAIGRIVAALPAGASVIAFSPIGMRAETTRSDLLPDMLAAVLGNRPDGAASNGAAGSAIWHLRARLPGNLRSALARSLPGLIVRDLTSRLQLRGTDGARPAPSPSRATTKATCA